ncbi:unnamed protein product [Heterobilharzia americana]|nr:unnamed protein product [Heterobilharzia americana]
MVPFSSIQRNYMSKALKKQGTHSDRLQVLVEKVTTSGFNAPDDVLVCEIIDLCCISSATVSDLFRLATVQLLRKHAQIRLGVLRLLRMLSSPREIFEKVNYSVDDSAKFIHVAKYLRNLI